MTTSRRTVAFIPVRGGSRSIPGKNIRRIGGRPLLHWVLDATCGASGVDEVVVSTDDADIARVARAYPHGTVTVVGRSPESATDTAATEIALLEFAATTDADTILLAQATSPLTEAAHVDEALSRFVESGADSLVTVVRQHRFRWDVDASGFATPLNYDPVARPRRQDFAGDAVENGAFYVVRRDTLMRTRCRLGGRMLAFEMPPHTDVELDEPEDWAILDRRLRDRTPHRLPQLAALEALVTDVDGVLTDAGMYVGADGQELKKFNTHDGMGIERLRNAGLAIAIISGERSAAIERRAAKLSVTDVFLGVRDKRPVLYEWIAKRSLTADRVAYVGDDVNDLEALRAVGFSAAPADARPEVRAEVDYVCERAGGRGCVREIAELVLTAKASAVARDHA